MRVKVICRPCCFGENAGELRFKRVHKVLFFFYFSGGGGSIKNPLKCLEYNFLK